jgi:malate dehydrogenase (quinone)
MIDLVKKCFPEQYPAWEKKLARMIPSFGTQLNESRKATERELDSTARGLQLIR